MGDLSSANGGGLPFAPQALCKGKHVRQDTPAARIRASAEVLTSALCLVLATRGNSYRAFERHHLTTQTLATGPCAPAIHRDSRGILKMPRIELPVEQQAGFPRTARTEQQDLAHGGHGMPARARHGTSAACQAPSPPPLKRPPATSQRSQHRQPTPDGS